MALAKEELTQSTAEDERSKSQLEWIEFKQYSASLAQETFKEKVFRKIKDNPFVPIGVIATTVALSLGLWTLKTGDKKRSQLMMRFRVVAQGFTIAALIVGVGIGATKTQKSIPDGDAK